jgi:hypothetical protein
VLDPIGELKRCFGTRHFFVELVIGIKYVRPRELVQTLNERFGRTGAAADECRHLPGDVRASEE